VERMGFRVECAGMQAPAAMAVDLSSRALTGGAAALRCSSAPARPCALRPFVAHATLSVEAPKAETGDIREQAHRRGVPRASTVITCTARLGC